MKQHVLGDRLFNFQWIGVFWNVISVILVGGTAILNESEKSIDNDESTGDALLGVLLVMAGALVQAMQFVFEEKVMTMVRAHTCVLAIFRSAQYTQCLTTHIDVFQRIFLLPRFS